MEPYSPPVILELGHGQPVSGQAGLGARAGLQPSHKNKPPRKNEKELKVKYRGMLRGLNRVASPITEGIDILDAVYDALPYEQKAKYNGTRYLKRDPTVIEKVKALYSGYDYVDWHTAGENIGKNFFGDLAGGLTGQAVGKVQRDHDLAPNSLSGAFRGFRRNNKALAYQERIKKHAEEQKRREEELDQRRWESYLDRDARRQRPLWWQ